MDLGKFLFKLCKYVCILFKAFEFLIPYHFVWLKLVQHSKTIPSLAFLPGLWGVEIIDDLVFLGHGHIWKHHVEWNYQLVVWSMRSLSVWQCNTQPTTAPPNSTNKCLTSNSTNKCYESNSILYSPRYQTLPIMCWQLISIENHLCHMLYKFFEMIFHPFLEHKPFLILICISGIRMG